MAKVDRKRTDEQRTDEKQAEETRAKAGGRRREPLRVLVVRHGVAAKAADTDRERSADAERQLTDAGRRKMRDAARGLVDLVPDLAGIATSPLARAVETADLIARRYAKVGADPKTIRLPALAPGKPANAVLGWLAVRPRGGGTVAVVGHEPGLSQFASWALTGLWESFVCLKKGQALLLEFDDEVRAGRARLLWSLRAGQLRKIGRAARAEG
ncbi:MAG: phosphohistidine phosphatase [Phycisphaerales bacterium]|nr:phosphohistidine phosphatase [Phycisphaerales bacterium]